MQPQTGGLNLFTLSPIMECPRPQDYAAARRRLSMATESWTPGTVTIQGIAVRGSVRMGAETFTLDERGPQRIQSVEIRVCKDLVAGIPCQGDIVRVNGRAFKITSVDGFMADELDWFLSGSRTPGGDEA